MVNAAAARQALRRLGGAWHRAEVINGFSRRVVTVSVWALRKVEDRVVDDRYRREGLDTNGPDIGYHGSEDLGYVATDWRVIRSLFPAHTLGPDDVLLDYGCGKGRVALWAASRFPVRRVVGVDLDPELVVVARANQAGWARPLRCRDVVFECVDARHFDVPDDVTVVYMFNPFMGEAFAQVVAKMGESLARRPRSLRVIYFYPIMHNCLVDAGFEVEQFHRDLFYAWATYHIG